MPAQDLSTRTRHVPKIALAFALVAIISGCSAGQKTNQPTKNPAPTKTPSRKVNSSDTPAILASWPWPKAKTEALGKGITHWLDKSSPDGTTLELFEFDFSVNPRLRFEMYDQDEDDKEAFDNRVYYWKNGLGHTVRQLNQRRQGRVLAAWNGLYFGLKNNKPRAADWAFHLTPIVLNGKVHSTSRNHRWTFGVRRRNGSSEFSTVLLPTKEQLQQFDYASGGAQCLFKNGEAMRIQPFPEAGATPLRPPVPTQVGEAGHIPSLDHIRTSRVSMGWTADSKKFYLLFVKENDGEVKSRLAFSQRLPVTHPLSQGGWMLSDVQRFWQALQRTKGVTDAVNSDGADVAQLTYLRADDNYEFVPPFFVVHAKAPDLPSTQTPLHSATQRLVFKPNFKNALPGGTMMYFYIREE